MDLAINIDSITPQLSGIGRYTFNLCEFFSKNPEIDDILYFHNKRWISDYRIFLEDADPFVRNRLRRWKWLARWKSQREFERRVFHGPNFFLPEGVDRGVITVHDLSVFLFPETHPEARRRAFDTHFEASLKQARHIITDTETVKNELCQMFGTKHDMVTAIPLGVSKDFGPQHKNPKSELLLARMGLIPNQYCLCVATVEPRKKLENAIRAFLQAIEKEGDPIRLVLAGGSGWHNEAIHALIDEAGGRVQFLGYVPDTLLPVLYANAALFLYPSIYEGFGLPPIEAMASGVPVIVSDRSCLTEVTQGAALQVDPDDLQMFAEAISVGLHDAGLREKSVAAGFKVSAGYSWALCGDRTLEVYHKVSSA